MRKIRFIKYSTYKLLSIFFAFLIFSGCDHVLDDVRDLSNYPGVGTFDDLAASNAYLAALYNSTLPSWPVNQGNWADETGSIIGPDWINPNNNTFDYFPYALIRRINIMLTDMPEGNLTADQQEPLIAQAKFLRAYAYFRMVSYYGGVPIIETPQSLDDDLFVSRNSTAECFNFIIRDLDDAIANLPPKYTGSDYGRVDRAAALAFKGRVLLHKASPQFNSANPYDNQYWSDAYTANKAAKDFLDANGYGLLDNYTDVFLTEGHKENILSVVFQSPVKVNGRQEHGVRPLSQSKNATGHDQPIWDMVEAFPMKDGRMPGDPESAYDYDLQTFWENRDPRFGENIVYNGAVFELSGIAGRRQYTMANIGHNDDVFSFPIQVFYRTGFYARKGVQAWNSSELVDMNDVDWPEIRYAEVLFNYAEAANETGRPDEAVQVLKDIRERAGIEPGADNMYGLDPGMNREEIRDAILHEKRIEMMLEGRRFWDLRRHRMLDRIDGMRKYGLMALTVDGRTYDEVTQDDISKALNFGWLPEDFEYDVVELITSGPREMAMPEEYYFFPIKLSHIDRNPNLEQNIDWGGNFNPEL